MARAYCPVSHTRWTPRTAQVPRIYYFFPFQCNQSTQETESQEVNHTLLDKSSGLSDSEQKSLVTAGLVEVEQWTVSPPPVSLL